MRTVAICTALGLVLGGCAASGGTDTTGAIRQLAPPVVPEAARANPANWPAARSPAAITDAATEAAIDALIARMTLRQKIGQVIQADIGSITPADLATYPLGSLLAGGNSGPYGNERGSAADWDRMVREFRAVSMRPGVNGVAIPILFGVDAVHGHNNLPGATTFPHNIGLGATRDTDLIRRIGVATAAEIAGSGIEWTFAPTLAVPQDLRWGRAYEGYSSDPAIVALYSKAMVAGLQGTLIAGQSLAADKVAATAKHFVADGGTRGGKDQGDAQISESELVRIHAPGYPVAIDEGALTLMASFSSWNGQKHHGNATLLTDVVKGRMGFEGLIVGDWNAHGQLPGCSNTDCPDALLAGLDLYMASDSWKGLFDSLLARAEKGEIPMNRLDDAVRRILRVKHKIGLMDGQPNDRGDHAQVGAPAHLALAREAVARSLVLLKNEGSALPVRPGARVLVTGAGADSMAMQNGGWTVSWQGTDVTRADFPNGQTIWEGLRDAIGAAGGTAVLSANASFTAKPDVAIVVFGENPYAEFQGDVADLGYRGREIETIRRLKAQGIKVVSVFLSGRPMFTGAEMAASDAFVAAWLPGSQGAGVADVLVAGRDGRARRDFTGMLSFAWPSGCEPGAPPLFPLGAGWSYAEAPVTPALRTDCPLASADVAGGLALYDRGLRTGIAASAGGTSLVNLVGSAPGIRITGFDVAAQEDARRIAFSAPASLRLNWDERAFAASAGIEMTVRVNARPAGSLVLTALGPQANAGVDLAPTFALMEGKDWRTLQVPLACLAKGATTGISLASEGAFVFEVQSIRIVPKITDTSCTGPF